MSDKDKVAVYIIPENFIDEGRIINGMFKTRNFIEGAGLALIVVALTLLIPISSIEARITVTILCAAPFFMLGLSGYNGDCLSTAAKSISAWRKNRTVMIYDTSSKPLKMAPVDYMMSRELPKDKILGMIEARKERKREEASKESFIPGIDFEFAEEDDPNIIFVDPDEDDEDDDEEEESSGGLSFFKRRKSKSNGSDDGDEE